MVVENINDALNDALREKLKKEIIYIFENEGSRLPEIMEKFKIKRAQAQRDMATLKEAQLVLFSGSKKTGKYQQQDKLYNKLRLSSN